MPQRLEIYQSLWAMEQRQPGIPEAPASVHFERIKAAGYQGVCIDPNVEEINDALALAPLFKDHQLSCMVNAFPNTVDELTPPAGYGIRITGQASQYYRGRDAADGLGYHPRR